ncbi:MAG: hypothetical protein DMG70_20595 [Acidobacteria bacterium]|nr:MAG: hypothetical protein DMG70_20595 [Acidobacteriota bacterium]
MLWLAAERKPVILKTGESRFSAYEIWNWLFLFKTLFRSDLFQRQVDDAELGGRGLNMPQSRMDRDLFIRGIRLFNEGRFFEAHEILEDVWRPASSSEKQYLQGLIQLAVAFHHQSTGNSVGACSLMERGMRNLSQASEDFGNIRRDRLIAAVSEWQQALRAGVAIPPRPQIEIVE